MANTGPRREIFAIIRLSRTLRNISRTGIRVSLQINKLLEFVLIPIIKFNSGSAREYDCAFMMYKNKSFPRPF